MLPGPRRPRLAADGAIVAAGQAASALGALAGIRLLTEFVSPATFGAVTLAVGLSSLVISVSSTPLNQALIHLYPSFAQRGAVSELVGAVAARLVHTGWVLAAGVIVASAFYVFFLDGQLGVCLALAALTVFDALRSSVLAILNASRRHGRHATWSAMEVWLRPVAAILAVVVVGDTLLAVLSAYAITSLAFWLAFGRGIVTPERRASTAHDPLQDQLMRYARPLIPLGIVGWVSGVGDRYFIGAIMSVADAGVYAAAYALVSRPFLMLGQTFELAVRPVYQTLVVEDPCGPNALGLLRNWFAALLAVGLAGLMLVGLWHVEIADLLLGSEYRSAATLMPWIAAGYFALVLAHVFERVCYAYGDSARVLTVQSVAAVAGGVATVIGTVALGLKGAAIAVPIGFSIHLWLAAQAARRSFKLQQVMLHQAGR